MSEKRFKGSCPGCAVDVLQVWNKTDYAIERICQYGHVTYQSGSQLMLARQVNPTKVFDAVSE